MNKWIEWKEDFIFECPYCHFVIEDKIHGIEEFFFCPKCGKQLIEKNNANIKQV